MTMPNKDIEINEDVKFNELIVELINNALNQKHKTGNITTRRDHMKRIIDQYLIEKEKQS